jgi:TPR repeat protein
MYASGTGVEKSESNAFLCYEFAANSGDMMAKYILGTWLVEGKGCQKDVGRGIELQVNDNE